MSMKKETPGQIWILVLIALFFLAVFLIYPSANAQGSAPSPPTSHYIKDKQWHNIRDYGAVGDSVTDDRVAIQAALDAGAGGIIYVPEGIYFIEEPSGVDSTWAKPALQIASNTTLLGIGRGSEFRFDTAFYGIGIRNADTINGDSGIIIDGIFVNGQQSWANYDSLLQYRINTNPFYGTMVHFKGATHSVIRNCFLANSKRDATGFGGCGNITVTECFMWNNAEDAIVAAGALHWVGWVGSTGTYFGSDSINIDTNTTNCNGVCDSVTLEFPYRGEEGAIVVTNNTLHGTGSDFQSTESATLGAAGEAITIKGSNLVIANNRVRWFVVAIGFFHEGWDSLNHITVTGNVMQSVTTQCMNVTGAYDVSVTGNSFSDFGGYGISIGGKTVNAIRWNTSKISITGNTFSKSTYGIIYPPYSGALYLGSGSNVVFSNNVIDSMAANGVYIRALDAPAPTGDGTGDGNIIISGNRITNCTFSGIRVDSSYRISIMNNQIMGCGNRGIEINSNASFPINIWNGVDSVDNMIITGNLIIKNDGDGIFLGGVNYSIVSNNIITDNNLDDTTTTEGLYLFYSHDNHISDNMILNGHDIGLRLAGGSSKNMIINNYIGNNTIEVRTDTSYNIWGWLNDTIVTDTNECTPSCDSITYDTLFTAYDDSNFVWGNKIGTGDIVADTALKSKYYIDNHLGGVTYSLPAADGSAGQGLVTDGSATVAWTTVGGSGETNVLVDTGTFNGTEGFGLKQTKVGSELRIRGLIEGTNTTMSYSGDTGIVITTAAGGSFNWTDSIGFIVGWGGVRLAVVNDTTYLSFEGSADFDTTNGIVSLAVDYLPLSSFDSGMVHLNGMSYDKPVFTLIQVNGVAGIQMDIEKDGGGDMVFRLDTVNSTLDCTTGGGAGGKARVALTAGSDANTPTTNYVYVTNSGGTATLTSSTSLPTGSFGWIGKVIIPDTVTFNLVGAYGYQRYTEAFSNDDRGTESHAREKLRALGAVYISGATPSCNIDTQAGAADSVDVTTTAGSVYQLHRQSWPAIDTSALAYFGNGTTIYDSMLDINNVLTEQDGTSLVNSRFNLIIWGAINYSSGDCKMFVNKPNGSYSTNNNAIADVDNTADYSVPDDMRSVAFLIARVVLSHSSASSGTWTELGCYSLLGQPVGVRSAGIVAGAGSDEFPDNAFRVFDNGDATKLIAFEASGITTGNTRTFTVPDENGTLVTTDGFTMGGNIVMGSNNITGIGDVSGTNAIMTSAYLMNATQLNDGDSLKGDVIKEGNIHRFFNSDNNAAGLDSLNLVDPNDDTVLIVTDDDAGNVVLKIGADQSSFTIGDGGTTTIDSIDAIIVDADSLVTNSYFVYGGAIISEAEMEILDGATLTTTEINYVDGVTSAIQTQLDGKLSTSGQAADVDSTGTEIAAALADRANIHDTLTMSFSISAIDDTWDWPFQMRLKAITVVRVSGVCISGTNVVGVLMEYDNDAANPAVMNSSDWTFTTGEESFTSFSNASIDDGDYIGWKTTSVSGDVDFFTLTINYTVD